MLKMLLLRNVKNDNITASLYYNQGYNDSIILLYNPSLFLYDPSLFQIRPQPFPLQGQPAPNTRLAFSNAKSILFLFSNFITPGTRKVGFSLELSWLNNNIFLRKLFDLSIRHGQPDTRMHLLVKLY